MIEWRVVPSFPKYLVSEDGQVRHRDSAKPRKLNRINKNYRAVNFWHDKKLRCVTVHRMVAEAFHGPRPEGMEVRHLDGDGSNNHHSNLRYGTKVENAADRERHGRTARGDRSGTTKLPDADVEMLRLLHTLKAANQYQLAVLFGISQAQVNNIVLNKQRQKAA